MRDDLRASAGSSGVADRLVRRLEDVAFLSGDGGLNLVVSCRHRE